MDLEELERVPLRKRLIKIRGYNKEIRPKYDILLPISIIASDFCPTSRDVYLRYVLNKKPRITKWISRGSASHQLLDTIFKNSKKPSKTTMNPKLKDIN